MSEIHQSNAQPIIALAAGGTGGHIFPAEALADTLIKRGWRVILLTDPRFSGYGGVLGNIEIHTVTSGRLGGGVAAKLKAMLGIARGTLQARRIFRKLRPGAVIGFGGYPSFPPLIAAAGLRIPTIVHEQNAILGRSNRMLAKYVSHIAASFPETRLLDAAEQAKTVVTGNPVRANIRALSNQPYPEFTQDGELRILVTGGSQGAHIFSEVMPKALALLPAALRGRVRITQQCREEDIAAARAAYEALGHEAELSSFFSDMPERLAQAHLVIARSGASTVFELAAAGRPAILVPLPGSADGHQHVNADLFAASGGGWVMTQDGLTPQALAAKLENFLSLPSSLKKAAKQAKSFGRLDAVEALADLVEQAAGSAPARSANNPPVEHAA